ncbi:unnamed protein product [Bursaphelenchus okinawaensis]|uniref:Uncharacterized protein n=1 Tax=Bursaphelenchus okinawaensis TaxID=465554 RepID=A0A811JRI7_9BILA|nr:unnamed protein product [Bursaphelenchus okinawaensis]CAG9080260.1 unnamed protein product [Bursaphelenchus okinawaensis]
MDKTELNELEVKPTLAKLRWNQPASACVVEVLDVLREVLEDFKGRLDIVDVESVFERPSGELGYLQDQFYTAYKTLSKQDQRGGFVCGFENKDPASPATSSVSVTSRSPTTGK